MAELFDEAESRRRKREGMQRAADKRRWMLDLAREHAFRLARAYGEVNADDVAAALAEEGRTTMERLGPGAGSIFSGKQWEFTGRRVMSKRPANHARELKVWRLSPIGHGQSAQLAAR